MPGFPPILPKNELYSKSLERAKLFLNTDYANASAEDRGWFVEQINEMESAMSGDIRACSNIAHVFSDITYPGLADPQLAFHWYGWGLLQTDTSNWIAYRGMPGGTYDSTLQMFTFFMAKMLVLFGTPAEKQVAKDTMIKYIGDYRGHKYLGSMVSDLIYTLCGVPAEKVFRSGKYDMSCIVNKELATQYYKQLIDDEVSDGNHNGAKLYADDFEHILGISYYQRAGHTANKSSSPNTAKGGCYIATCVYGSYDCPQVWTLRRFRDNVLAEHFLGRVFIKIYYTFSPHIVRIFGHSKTIRNGWQYLLNKLVSKLNASGLANTPYDD